jgi:hypothetical protein
MTPRNTRFNDDSRLDYKAKSADPRYSAELGNRLREIREDLYGTFGAELLAKALDIPTRTWLNYEAGVVVPALIVLRLQVLSGVSAQWLLDGEGEKYDR